jgi:hypothetical protein
MPTRNPSWTTPLAERPSPETAPQVGSNPVMVMSISDTISTKRPAWSDARPRNSAFGLPRPRSDADAGRAKLTALVLP